MWWVPEGRQDTRVHGDMRRAGWAHPAPQHDSPWAGASLVPGWARYIHAPGTSTGVEAYLVRAALDCALHALIHICTERGDRSEGAAVPMAEMGVQSPAPPPSHICLDTEAVRHEHSDCGVLALGTTLPRKEKDLQPQKDDTQGTMGTGHPPGTPALTMAGLPVGQQPVAGGAEAAVAARAVPALVLALVQCLALIEVCRARKGEGKTGRISPLWCHSGANLALISPSQHSKDHRAQRKWWTGQQEGHKVSFGDKVVSELLATPFPNGHSPVQVPFLLM